MRRAFVETLGDLAGRDPRVVLLTADMGYNALETFAAAYPNRFYNVGVAEQNMLALATGLAEAGFIPYCYSIAPFAVLRPYEFIRNGPIAHGLPVRLVGMGGGLAYGTNGFSHHGIDDVGALRVQRGLGIYVPADSAQTRTILERTAAEAGPVYYRLEKDDAFTVPELGGRFTAGAPEHVMAGRDVLFVAMGGIAATAVAAARELGAQGISAGVAVASTLHHLDLAPWNELLRAYRAVIAVEAHYANGGLGSAVAERMAESGLCRRFARRAITASPDGVTGSPAWLAARHGLAVPDLVAAARTLLESPEPSTSPPA